MTVTYETFKHKKAKLHFFIGIQYYFCTNKVIPKVLLADTFQHGVEIGLKSEVNGQVDDK